VAQQVERAHPLGHAGRVVRGELDDPVRQPDPLGALTRRGEEDLRRRGVAVLLEEVVLDLPGEVVPQPIGQLDLREGLLEEVVLAALVPGARKLVLVEDAELHRASLHAGRSGSPRTR
jgi:hypothetical protein